MAFNDLEYHAVKKEVEAFVESIRPPAHVRNELDIVFTIDDQSIEIGEKRPVWRGEPGEFSVLTSAKITYVRTQKVWNLYWMRASEKWELYSEERTLAVALNQVRDDIHSCFFG
ncbi:DUF3024 domain-containing protein [Rahnella contaminans]|uniref:DUF3024 domain-containing protein n=1 Tax=Rahnella contaminans TaxID=2703882 RepID=UPI0023D9D462|nr:DUF3024 domain-containing protein [Rahnella contaminans]MDF1895062.1 DUF3024 domain-containing protein [Rahnella contaminans]